MFGIEMFGRLLAGLIVIGLAIGVWLVWPEGDTPATTTSTDLAVVSSTTTVPSSSTTSTSPSTTNTAGGLEVIDTNEEAEQLLRQLWFGWFEGIYNQDEERIKEVVASQSQLDAARSAFGAMEFESQPTEAGIVLSEVEVLRADTTCTAIWGRISAEFRDGESEGVHTFRSSDSQWKYVNSWPLRGDLWAQDCDAQLEPLS